MPSLRRQWAIAFLVAALAPTTVSAFSVTSFVNNVVPRMANSVADVAEAINGETYREIALGDTDGTIDVSSKFDRILHNETYAAQSLDQGNGEGITEDTLMPFAPPLTFTKYLTMQDKRVIVEIRYSSESGLKPYYMTAAKRIKDSHPDVLLNRRIMPAVDNDDDDGPKFEVVVDNKVVVSRNKRTHKSGTSVYVSMAEVNQAIARARRRRRPDTLYGFDGDDLNPNVRLAALRSNESNDNDGSNKTGEKKN